MLKLKFGREKGKNIFMINHLHETEVLNLNFASSLVTVIKATFVINVACKEIRSA